MKKLLLLLVVLLSMVLLGLSSCQREYTDYTYRVRFITSGAKTTVISREKGVETFGSYSVGDTVHVNHGDTIVTDGRYRKAVIIKIIM